jgi:hypothetical protein
MENSIETIARQILERIDKERKLKARCGLDDDTLRVAIVGFHGTTGVDATVTNNGEEYGVYLCELIASCTCKDYEHRQKPCKHAAAVCYTILGTTTPAAPETFTCGEKVQLRGISSRVGTVRCVSEFISVDWPALGRRPACTNAHTRVELERARP